MDWNAAIDKNREALKRIVAMLVGMAGLGRTGSPSPLWGFEADLSIEPVARSSAEKAGEIAEQSGSPAKSQASRGGSDTTPTRPSEDGRPPLNGEVDRPTLPRQLHRAILRLLRPAESATRRLIIIAARGLEIAPSPPRPAKPKPASIFLRNRGGTGIVMPRGVPPTRPRPAPRAISLPLFDPDKHYFRLRRPALRGVPRISVPGITRPFPIAVRRPPAPGDPLDATRLQLRLTALASALDDLPRQARRLARWKANRDAAVAQAKNREAQAKGTILPLPRLSPLRPGRPPGSTRRPNHEVHELLKDLHGLAIDVLHPDTS